MGDQVHDFEPGIRPSGLFWTIPITPSAITVNRITGTATLKATNLAVPDYGNFFNAISPAPDPAPVPSHVSFEVTWAGHGEVREIDDEVFDFSGRFVVSDATTRSPHATTVLASPISRILGGRSASTPGLEANATASSTDRRRLELRPVQYRGAVDTVVHRSANALSASVGG